MKTKQFWMSLVVGGVLLAAQASWAATVTIASPGLNSWNGKTVSVGANATPGSGETVDSVQFQYNNNGGGWTDFGDPDTTSPYSASFDSTLLVPLGSIETVFEVRAIATVTGGPTPVTSSGRAIKIDNQVPTSATVNTATVVGTTVTVTWNAASDGVGSGIYGYNIAINKNSTMTLPQTRTNLTLPGTLTASSGDGEYYIHIITGDKNTNVGGRYWTDTVSYGPIVVDSTAPTGSIFINDGDAATTDANVTLTLSATDPGDAPSGVADMRISNASDFSTGTGWIAYNAAPYAWVLDDPGTLGVKTVYVQYRDTAGNVSISYSDTITLAKSVNDLTVGAVGPFIYNGLAQTPEPTVNDGVPLLTKDIDYTLAYADNTNVGTATITITGIGNYTGTRDVNFDIDLRTIEITADSDSKAYDGTALTDSGYSVTGGDGLAGGQTLDSVTVTGSQTVVGISNNVPSAAVILDAGLNNVTASYAITYANGTLEVTQRAITITADSNTKIYDGTALTDSGYSITAGTLGAGDTLDAVTVTGSQTVVGTSNNVPSAAVILDAGLNNVTTSYAITYANGTLEVTQRAITITADSNTKEYDGTALTDSGYSVTGGDGLAGGQTLDSVTVTGSQTVVGTSNNIPSVAVILEGMVDVTANYDITYANGTLEVTQRAITITADSDTKIYDGTALTDSGYSITAGTLGAGDTLDAVTVTGSQTVVGISNNVPSAAVILDAGLNNVTASYAITYANGSLEVTQRAITITADSNTKIYDGTALTDSGYSITAGTLAAGDTLDAVTVTGSQTVVGTSNNIPSVAVILDAGLNNVTASYAITYAAGTLEITTRPLEITANSDSKNYDGTPLTNDGYMITGGTLVVGHEIFMITITGSQTASGSSPNVASDAFIFDVEENDVTANYDITYVDGTLTVIGIPIEITAASDTKIYDGTALTNAGYSLSAGTLVLGHTLAVVTVTGSQTAVGSSDNVPSAAVILDAGLNNVTANYAITYIDGTLTVTTRLLEITADSNSKVYDGTALTDSGYSITAGSLAVGDSLDAVTVTGSQTAVGSSANVPSAAVILDAGLNNVTANYDIIYVDGTLEVTARALEITADSNSKVYDGTALTDGGYSITAGSLAVGDTLDAVTVTGSQTVVGSSDNVASAAVILDGVVNVTANYDITYVDGALEVTVRPLEITADDGSKVYDGTELTNAGFSITGGTLAPDQTLDSVTVTGSQTVVGSSANVASAAVITDIGDVDVTVNYDITYVDGTLTITARTLEITAASDSKVYDGVPLTNDEYTVTGGDGLVLDHAVDSVIVTGSQTDIGSSNNVASAAVIRDGAMNDVTANYDITYVDGTLTVTAAILSVDGGYTGRANHWVTVEISLEASNVLDFQLVMFDLEYDSAVLEFIEGRQQAIGGRIVGGTASIETYVDPGIVKVAIFDPEGEKVVTGAPDPAPEYGNKLLSLTFRVNGLAEGEIPDLQMPWTSLLDLTEPHIAATNGNVLDLDLVDGDFTTDNCYWYLDIDQTGEVDWANDGLFIYRAMLHDVNDLVPIVPPAVREELDGYIPEEEEFQAYYDFLLFVIGLDADGDTNVWASKDGVYIYRYLRYAGASTMPAGHDDTNEALINDTIQAWVILEECEADVSPDMPWLQ